MYDPIAFIWVTLWTSIGTYGLYLIYSENQAASDFYVYGKSLDIKKKDGLFWQVFLLPKSYFRHFYLSSLLVFSASFILILIYYVPSLEQKAKLNETLETFIKLSNKNHVKIDVSDGTLISITSLVFTLILMTVQCSRRLYESLFISVYSNQSKINLIHYLFGHLFYLMAAISTVCPILLSETSHKYTFTKVFDNIVTKPRALTFVLFIYTSHHQYKCHKILADLRKDKTGQVISDKHYVPSGGLFEFVSCPHFLTEVIIYFLILLSQGFKNYYWNLLFLLVITTQTINALTEHRWYKRKYKDYPKDRKAIFPKLL